MTTLQAAFMTASTNNGAAPGYACCRFILLMIIAFISTMHLRLVQGIGLLLVFRLLRQYLFIKQKTLLVTLKQSSFR